MTETRTFYDHFLLTSPAVGSSERSLVQKCASRKHPCSDGHFSLEKLLTSVSVELTVVGKAQHFVHQAPVRSPRYEEVLIAFCQGQCPGLAFVAYQLRQEG